MTKRLILASQSPRRRELLELMGFDFTTMSADVDESSLPCEDPVQLVSRLAQLKAQTIASQLDTMTYRNSVVLAADTLVVADSRVLNKPIDFQDFCSMMACLSGKRHTVMTGVCVMDWDNEASQVIQTDVCFSELSQDDIRRYWHTGEPLDKAGGYGIQGIGGQFVRAIKGSYSAVVGLPMAETKQLLTAFGVRQ